MRYGSGGGRGRRAGVLPVGQVALQHLDALQIEGKIREHTAPLVWAEVVGPQVAAATEVNGVRDGLLMISTKSAVWSNELTFYKTDILQRLNARLGARPDKPVIADIHFQNHGLKKKKARERAAKDAPPPLAPSPAELDDTELSPAELALIEKAISVVGDEALRGKMRKVRIADLKLRTWRLDNGWVPCARCGDLAPPHHLSASGGGGGAAAACPRCRIAAAGRPPQGGD